MDQPYRILLIENDPDLATRIAGLLREQGGWVTTVQDGQHALSLSQAESYDLIGVDQALPEMDGLMVCKKLRSHSINPPILLLSDRDEAMSGILGLEIGADCYVEKPLVMRELVARVKALLRRQSASIQRRSASPTLLARGLKVAHTTRSVTHNGTPITLTPKEFDLLWHLASNPDRVFTRSQLLDAVWVYSHDGYEHTVNSHINRLRAKIELNPSAPSHIITVWGVGYKFSGQGMQPEVAKAVDSADEHTSHP